VTKELCVIYNPSAGRGKSARRWDRVRELLQDHAVLQPTTHAGHAVELARRAAQEGFSTIAAAGGDGTVHEVMNGLVASSRGDVAFGVLPLGSGNDYARVLGVPFDPDGMVGRLRSAEHWQVDVGQVILDGGLPHYFCNTLGLGLSGAVTHEARQIRWLRGIPLYGWAALKGIVKHFHSVPVVCREEGVEWQTDLLYLAVAVGKAEGGGFVVAPEAKLDDGWFDLLHVTKLTRLRALAYLPRMVLGRLPADSKTIQRRRVRGLNVASQASFAVHADGELLATPEQGARECEVTMLPGRLRVCGRPV
jgi:diacylglycerol kinase (ATP)